MRRIVLHLPTATPDLDAWRRIAVALGARAGAPPTGLVTMFITGALVLAELSTASGLSRSP